MIFSFVAIQVRELAPSVEFYGQAMGMSITREFTAGPDHIVMMKGKGCGVELVCGPEGPKASVGSHPVLGFDVEDLDQVLERLAELGVQPFEGPASPNPGVRFAMVHDPNGVKIELLEHK